MKKKVVLILAATMMLTLVACGEKTENESNSPA